MYMTNDHSINCEGYDDGVAKHLTKKVETNCLKAQDRRYSYVFYTCHYTIFVSF